MNVLYILLGGKAAKPADSMTPTMFVAYGEDDGGPRFVSWSAPGSQPNAPLAHLTDQAREAMWHTEGNRVLKRYDAESQGGIG